MSTTLLSHIRSLAEVRVDTGDIHRHSELFRKRFKNSTEELLASLAFQLDGFTDSDFIFRPEGTVVLSRQGCRHVMNKSDKADMKITLKLFMSDWEPAEVDKCVLAALRQLDVSAISQFIVAFPFIDEEDENNNDSEKEEVRRWLERVMPVWRRLEQFVGERRIYSLGVADLCFDKLRALYEAAECVRPMIDHYNIDDCCSIPEELREYASANDIQLLVHNDPPLCYLQETVSQTTGALFGGDNLFELDWTARYTVWLRSRSIIGSKGYILQFRQP